MAHRHEVGWVRGEARSPLELGMTLVSNTRLLELEAETPEIKKQWMDALKWLIGMK